MLDSKRSRWRLGAAVVWLGLLAGCHTVFVYDAVGNLTCVARVPVTTLQVDPAVLPSISPAGAAFACPAEVNVELGTTAASTAIYYTDDASVPDPASASTKRYTGPFRLAVPGTVKALAVGNLCGEASLPAIATYLCAPPQQLPPTEVVCHVFDDGNTNIAGPSAAITFNAQGAACIPDGGTGICRKWFGRCQTVPDAKPVALYLFNDGDSDLDGPTDAVTINRLSGQACRPDGSTGVCRKWFGRIATESGREGYCFGFNDGGRNKTQASGAFFAHLGDREVCVPDGTSSGRCRKWFGLCAIPN